MSFETDSKIDLLMPGENVETEHLIAMYPPILTTSIDRPPNVNANRVHLIVNQMADQLYNGENFQYDPRMVRGILKSVFGSEGEWCGISPLVNRLMTEDDRYPKPSPVIWTPLLDTDHWCGQEIRWRGGGGKLPIIGRHGRWQYTKWPASKEALEQAYCVQMGWETRFLGGADPAIELLGGQPPHWNVIPFSHRADDVYEFLHGLDFLIHFPHESYIEEFGRCVMEAMAVGRPVILPHRFRETFGDAAIYCEPADVADRIAELWADEASYLERAQVGRRFVLDNCSLERFGERLRT